MPSPTAVGRGGRSSGSSEKGKLDARRRHGEAARWNTEACMIWTDVRRRYPNQWLLVEALLAHSKAGKRELDEMAVVDAYMDGETALRSYLKLHRNAPSRELYVVHSDREELEITERFLPGLRTAG